ncbi:hypothetical protein GGR26_003040 [Lewinella marina]|uniref:TonB-dependent receptor plug domain-containing protein n=1 Tax=Neolewinella marina TaxID=438751 RepID=A0A2G0CEM3_9BACT|nr:TonB-dependent receptor plug domain-containing protein [Neolewinella marina]NJB87260.1 hypothetical protein [Neolewinella marina]PHK98415.1 hypothetical protein CGL56_12035 [Neolewinella marina]
MRFCLFVPSSILRRSLAGLFLLLATALAGQDTLAFGVIDLPGAEVRASYRSVSPLAQVFTIEEVRKLPATFYDPARLIALLPGVVQTNDQANHLSVRGNTPNANLWRLNGLAIANPNHTSNAGTFYDYPTLSGGGVNALSAQVLDHSAFLAGGLPARYGQATGGTLDLRLRPGNPERRQHQLQGSFIGFDAATEGPVGQSGFTYLVNGRYSFTGLLADAGVDFGGETIRFADLNAHLHRRTDRGEVSLFAVAGRSTNLFNPDPEEELTEQKELFDIDYANDLLIVGGSFDQQYAFGKLTVGSAYSVTDADRSQAFTEAGPLVQESAARLQRHSTRAELERVVSPAASLSVGVEAVNDYYTLEQFVEGATPSRTTDHPQVRSFAPYLSVHWVAGESELDVAARPVWYYDAALVDDWVFEPRLRYQHRWSEQRIVAVAERLSRTPYAGLILKGEDLEAFVPVTNQAGLSYGRTLGKLNALVTAYLQHTGREYAAEADGFLLSANNFLEFDPAFAFTETTATRRYGVELEAGGAQVPGWFYRGSLSLFRAETEQRDGSWAKDRYSSDYVAKLTLGREWAGRDRRNRPRTYGLNLALITHGGERTGRIVAPGTGVSPYFTPPDYRDGFINTNGTYFRPDLRLYRTRERTRTTTTLSLDLQNVAGITNTAARYYDSYLNEGAERTALGLIPVLGYRIWWR